MMDNFIVGTCERMCPLDEIKLRTREKLLHFYERRFPTNPNQYIPDEPKVVKEFARSAAGVQAPKPHLLRTPQTLKRTIHYLLTDIVNDTRRPYNFAYDFMFDRLRAVRQEIVMQNFNEQLTIELLEPIIMFLAYSLYRLIEEPFDKFDPKICRQHLQECLKKTLACYDFLDEQNDGFAAPAESHRATIESLYLLFNLGSAEAMARAMKIPKNIRLDANFQLALAVSFAYWNRNFYRCLVNIVKLPYILSAVASLHVQNIRRELIQCFSVAYHSKVLTVPLDWIQKIFVYDSVENIVTDFRYYGFVCDHQSKSVKFQKESFDASKAAIKSRHENFVDYQLKASIEKILLFKCE